MARYAHTVVVVVVLAMMKVLRVTDAYVVERGAKGSFEQSSPDNTYFSRII